ncbi:MAG: hypothetical protein R3F60_25115 [bacterium]
MGPRALPERRARPGGLGNGGTLGAKLHPVADDGDLVALARAEAVDLVVIGPEAPLAAGLADAFRAAGVPCFGPGAAAAQLEASKAHAKAFMNRHGIPTAAHRAFTDAAAALAWPAPWPVVVKASGLAAGKGVIVPDDHAGAEAAIRDLFAGRYGEGGQTVVLEERLTGPELSILALCDGERFALLPPAQDHKRLLDGDRGPNTGGMGALAPARWPPTRCSPRRPPSWPGRWPAWPPRAPPTWAACTWG